MDAAAAQRDTVKRIFRQCDKNGDGDISLEELGALLKALGRFQSSEIKMIFSKMDRNGDGVIQFDEFVDWIFAGNAQDRKAKVAMMPEDCDGFQMTFYNYCPMGLTEMDGKGLAKLCKDADLFDKNIKDGDIGIIFRKAIGNNQTKITFERFPEVVRAIADRKGASYEDVRKAMAGCGAGMAAQRTGPRAGVAAPRQQRRPQTSEGGARAGTDAAAVAASGGAPAGGVADGLDGPNGRPQTSPAGPVASSVRDAFKRFCGGRPDLDCDGLVAICDGAGLIEGRFRIEDVRAIFQQVAAKEQVRISFRQFEEALAKIVEKKCMSAESVSIAVRSSNPEVAGEASNTRNGGSVTFAEEPDSPSSPSAKSVAEVHRSQSEKLLGKVSSAKSVSRVWSEKTVGQARSGPRLGDNLLPAGRPASQGKGAKSSRSRSPSPMPPAVDSRVSAIFQTFCANSGSDIDGKGFAKFCKDSGLLDKQFSAADVDIVFAEVMGQSRRMGPPHFEEALKKIASKKKTDVRSVESFILGCNGPSLSGTVADYVRLHDDFIDRPTAHGVARAI